MPYYAVRTRVQDYEQWKRVFDANQETRRSEGIKSEQVFRNPEHPNESVITFEVDDLEQARQVVESGAVRERQRQSGILEVHVYFPEA
jgi:hypothetical protein